SAELTSAMAADRRTAEDARRKETAARVPGTRPSLPLERIAGRYLSDIYGEVLVTARDGRLFLSMGEGARGELVHWHYDVFRLELDASSKGSYFTTFRINPAGQVDAILIEGMGELRRMGET